MDTPTGGRSPLRPPGAMFEGRSPRELDSDSEMKVSLREFHRIAAKEEQGKALASLGVAPAQEADPGMGRTLDFRPPPLEPLSPPARNPLESLAVQEAAPLPQGPDYEKYLNEGEQIFGLPGVTEGHVRQTFLEMDYDHKGFIGVSELRTLLSFVGERPTDDELDEMIRMLDAEGIGQVGYDEFQQLFVADHPVLIEMTQLAPQEDRTASKIAHDRRMAAKWAKNAHEEKLLLNAVSGFLHALNHKKKTEERQSVLPTAKAKAPGALRARPGGPPRAIPVSPRQAKKDREMRAKLGLPPLATGQPGMAPGMPGAGMPGGMPGMAPGMAPGMMGPGMMPGGGKGMSGALGMPPMTAGMSPGPNLGRMGSTASMYQSEMSLGSPGYHQVQ